MPMTLTSGEFEALQKIADAPTTLDAPTEYCDKLLAIGLVVDVLGVLRITSLGTERLSEGNGRRDNKGGA
jgi:hypothetical protein